MEKCVFHRKHNMLNFQVDELAQSLRRLNDMSKLLKHKRTANGALTLASSEVTLLKILFRKKENNGLLYLSTDSEAEEYRRWRKTRKQPLTNKAGQKIVTYSWLITCFKLFLYEIKELIIRLPFGLLPPRLSCFESLKTYDCQRFWI